MRDIHQVLERFGAWAANNREDVTWSAVAAGFKGLILSKVTSRPQCCDDDAMVICGCMARLNKNNTDMHELLMDYYVPGMTFMSLARKHGCSDTHIGKKLQNAGGYRGDFNGAGRKTGDGQIRTTGGAMYWGEIITGLIGFVALIVLLVIVIKRFGY